jgi:transcriptional regulator with XRE-family HTH domain
MNAPQLKTESRAYYRALGKHVEELRKGIGMTQAELARALRVSQQTVFAYELGDRRVPVFTLVRLAHIFDTTMEELSGLKIPIRPNRRLSPAGVRHAECYQKLSKTEQRFVKRIIDTLLGRTAAQPAAAST